MTSYQSIDTPQDYVNYTFNISSRGITEVAGEMAGLSNTVTTVLGQLAFKTSEYLTHTESLIIGLGTAATAAFASSTKEAIRFEQAVANVQAIGGESINAMEIGQAAMRYSSQFGMDVNSMTEGLEALSRAGLTATNVMSGVLAEGVKLSKLEGIDLEDSINDLIATTNLLAESDIDVNTQEYADAVKQMNQHIVSTSESSPINAQNIIQTLQHVGGYASANKIDQEDLFAVIAQLGAKGTKGEMAGTALRAFIAAGQKDQAQRALKRIGLETSDLWDSSGNIMLPVSEVKSILDDALEKRGYSQQEKLEFYSDFAGYKQANQIMKIDTSEVQEYKETIAQAWDLGKKLETILGTTHNNLQTLFQTVKNFMTRVGSTLLPVINAIVVPIKWGVQLLDAMPFSENITGMLLAFVGLKAAVLFINRVVPSIATLYTSFSGSEKKAKGIYGHFKNLRKELEQSKEILSNIADKEYLNKIRLKQGLMGRQSHLQHKDITQKLYENVFLRENDDALDWKELSSTQKELYYSITETLKHTDAYQDIIDQFNKSNEEHANAFIDAVNGIIKEEPESNRDKNKKKNIEKENSTVIKADDYQFAAQKNMEQVSQHVDEVATSLEKLQEGTQYDIGKSILSIKEPLAEAIGRAVAQSLHTREVQVSDTLGSFQINGRKAPGAIKQLQEIEAEVSVDLGDIGYFLDYDIGQIDSLMAQVRGDLQRKITAYQNDNPLFINDMQTRRMEKSISGLAKTKLGTMYSAEQNSIDILDVLKYGKVKEYKNKNIGIHEQQMDAIEKALGMDNQSGTERTTRLNNIHKYLRDEHQGTKAQKENLIREVLKITEDIWLNNISHDNPGVEASKFLTSDIARYIGNKVGIAGIDWNQTENPAQQLIEYFKGTKKGSNKDRQLKQADRLMFTFLEGEKAQGDIFNAAEAQEIGYLIRRYRQLLEARVKAEELLQNNKISFSTGPSQDDILSLFVGDKLDLNEEEKSYMDKEKKIQTLSVDKVEINKDDDILSLFVGDKLDLTGDELRLKTNASNWVNTFKGPQQAYRRTIMEGGGFYPDENLNNFSVGANLLEFMQTANIVAHDMPLRQNWGVSYGDEININPAFIKDTSKAFFSDLLNTVLHESAHSILQHHTRMDDTTSSFYIGDSDATWRDREINVIAELEATMVANEAMQKMGIEIEKDQIKQEKELISIYQQMGEPQGLISFNKITELADGMVQNADFFRGVALALMNIPELSSQNVSKEDTSKDTYQKYYQERNNNIPWEKLTEYQQDIYRSIEEQTKIIYQTYHQQNNNNTPWGNLTEAQQNLYTEMAQRTMGIYQEDASTSTSFKNKFKERLGFATGPTRQGISYDAIVEQILADENNIQERHGKKILKKEVKNKLSSGFYGEEFSHDDVNNIFQHAADELNTKTAQKSSQKNNNFCECFNKGIEKILKKIDNLMSIDAINIQTALLDRLKTSLGDKKYYEELEKLKATNEQNIRITDAGQKNEILDEIKKTNEKFDRYDEKIDKFNDVLTHMDDSVTNITDFFKGVLSGFISSSKNNHPPIALPFSLDEEDIIDVQGYSVKTTEMPDIPYVPIFPSDKIINNLEVLTDFTERITRMLSIIIESRNNIDKTKYLLDAGDNPLLLETSQDYYDYDKNRNKALIPITEPTFRFASDELKSAFILLEDSTKNFLYNTAHLFMMLSVMEASLLKTIDINGATKDHPNTYLPHTIHLPGSSIAYPYPIGPGQDKSDLNKEQQRHAIQREKDAKAEAEHRKKAAEELAGITERYDAKTAAKKERLDKEAAEKAQKIREKNANRADEKDRKRPLIDKISDALHSPELKTATKEALNAEKQKEWNKKVANSRYNDYKNNYVANNGMNDYYSYLNNIGYEKLQVEKRNQELLREYNNIQEELLIKEARRLAPLYKQLFVNYTELNDIIEQEIKNKKNLQGATNDLINNRQYPVPIGPEPFTKTDNKEAAQAAMQRLKERKHIEDERKKNQKYIEEEYKHNQKYVDFVDNNYVTKGPAYLPTAMKPTTGQGIADVIRADKYFKEQDKKIIDLVEENFINQYNQKPLDYSGTYNRGAGKLHIGNGDLSEGNLKNATQALNMFDNQNQQQKELKEAQARFKNGTASNADLIKLGITTPSKIEEERGKQKSASLQKEQENVKNIYRKIEEQQEAIKRIHEQQSDLNKLHDIRTENERAQYGRIRNQEENKRLEEEGKINARINREKLAQRRKEQKAQYNTEEQDSISKWDEKRKQVAEKLGGGYYYFGGEKKEREQTDVQKSIQKWAFKGIDLAEKAEKKGIDTISKLADQYPEKQANEYIEKIGGIKNTVEGALEPMRSFRNGLAQVSEIFPPLTIAVTAMDTAIQVGEGIVWALNMAEMVLSGTELFDTFVTWGLVTAEQAEALSKAVATVATWGLNAAIAAFEILISGPVLLAIAAIVAAVATVYFWEKQHAEALKKSQEELKEATAKNNAALSQYKDLKKAREAETDAIKKQQKARKEAIALYELEAARVKKRRLVQDEADIRNDAVWGEYGIRAALQKMGLGIIAGGDFESQYEKYDGTTKNIRQVKEETVGNIFATSSQRQVASFYDNNSRFFAEVEAYKEPLQELYDKESKLIEKYGSIEDARASKEFYEAVQEFSDATGINGKTAGMMLDWLETENRVDQATTAMQATASMIVAKADANAMKAMYPELDSEGEGFSGVENAMIMAQAESIYKDAYDQMWWDWFGNTLWGYFNMLLAILDPLGIFGNHVEEMQKHFGAAEAYEEGMKELVDVGIKGLYEQGEEAAEAAERRDYGLGTYGYAYGDTPFGGAKKAAAAEHADRKQKQAYAQNGTVYSDEEYKQIQDDYQTKHYGMTSAEEQQKARENYIKKEEEKNAKQQEETQKRNDTLGQLQANGELAHKDAQDIISAILGNPGVISGAGAGILSLADDNPLMKSLSKRGLKDVFKFMEGGENTLTGKIVNRVKPKMQGAKAAYADEGLSGLYKYGKQETKVFGNKAIDALEAKGINVRPYAEKGVSLLRRGRDSIKSVYSGVKTAYAEGGLRNVLQYGKDTIKGTSLYQKGGSLVSNVSKEFKTAKGVLRTDGIKGLKGYTEGLMYSADDAVRGAAPNIMQRGKDVLAQGKNIGIRGIEVGKGLYNKGVNKISNRISLARETNALAADGVPIARNGIDKAVGVFDGAKAAYAEDGLKGLAKFGKETGKGGIQGLAKAGRTASSELGGVRGVMSSVSTEVGGVKGLASSTAHGMKDIFNPKALAGGMDDIAKGARGGGTLMKGIGKVGGRALAFLGPALAFADKASELNPFEGKHYNEDGTEKKALQATGEVVGTTAGALGGVAGGLAGAEAGAALGATIGSVIPGVGTVIGGALGAVAGGIAGGWLGDTIFQPIGDAIGGTIGWLGDNLLGGIQNVAGTVWDGLTGAAGGVWDAVSGAATGVWDFLTGNGENNNNPVKGILGLTPIGMGVNAAAGIWDWLSGGNKEEDPYANVEAATGQKIQKSHNKSETTIVIKNININTEDDPEKIKSAFMNLMIELQEQISPRQVSRTIGEPPATSTDATTDPNAQNLAEGTDPNNPDANTNNNNNNNSNPTT